MSFGKLAHRELTVNFLEVFEPGCEAPETTAFTRHGRQTIKGHFMSLEPAAFSNRFRNKYFRAQCFRSLPPFGDLGYTSLTRRRTPRRKSNLKG